MTAKRTLKRGDEIYEYDQLGNEIGHGIAGDVNQKRVVYCTDTKEVRWADRDRVDFATGDPNYDSSEWR